MAGLTFVRRDEEEMKINTDMFSSSFFVNLLIVFLTLAVSYIVSVGNAFFNGYEWYIDEDNYNPAVAFINMSASLFAMFLFLGKTQGKRLFYLAIIILFIGLYLLSGSRYMPLGLLIILLLAYNEIQRRIPSLIFLGMLVVGIVVFYFISTIRADSVSQGLNIEEFVANASDKSIFDFAYDLVMNNRNLYVLVDFADTNGLTYGLTMLSPVLMLVPFAGTFVSESFGIPIDFMYVAGFNTYLEFGFGSAYGLGGNMVADVYLSFGFVGVLVAFIFLGFFVSLVISKYPGNVRYFIVYCLLAGNSVFMNRESFLLPLRPVLYSLLMFWILNSLFKNFKLNFTLKKEAESTEPKK
jgi:oligosaccharide repeat unit polymerase